MPRSSERLKHLKWMKNRVDIRMKLAMLRDLFDEESEGEDDLDELFILQYLEAKSRRQNLEGISFVLDTK